MSSLVSSERTTVPPSSDFVEGVDYICLRGLPEQFCPQQEAGEDDSASDDDDRYILIDDIFPSQPRRFYLVEAVFEGENPLKAYHLYKTFDAYYVSAAKYRKLFDNGQILIIPKLLRWKRLIIRMVESADCSEK